LERDVENARMSGEASHTREKNKRGVDCTCRQVILCGNVEIEFSRYEVDICSVYIPRLLYNVSI
jgi:hypothetical protein